VSGFYFEDYVEEPGKFIFQIPKEKICEVDRIVEAKNERGIDYAIIQLKTAPEGVEPLKIVLRSPQVGQQVYTLGYPDGLPLKRAYDAEIRRVFGDSPKTFLASLDTFSGNSGSPVFLEDEDETVILGILTNGLIDWEKSENGTMVPVITTDLDKGETVFMLENIEEQLRQLKLVE